MVSSTLRLELGMFVVNGGRSSVLSRMAMARHPENEVQGSWIFITIHDGSQDDIMAITVIQMIWSAVVMYFFYDGIHNYWTRFMITIYLKSIPSSFRLIRRIAGLFLSDSCFWFLNLLPKSNYFCLQIRDQDTFIFQTPLKNRVIRCTYFGYLPLMYLQYFMNYSQLYRPSRLRLDVDAPDPMSTICSSPRLVL